MAAITAVPSSNKRTSEEAGFSASPPKHRKLNTSLALALSPATESKDDDEAAFPSLAILQTMSAQEQARIDRFKRTWMIEFDSEFITPGPDAPLPPGSLAPDLIQSTRKVSLWRLWDCKRYEGRKVIVSFYLTAGTQLVMMGNLRIGGSWKHFQGRMHPGACEGWFVFNEADFGVEDDKDDEDDDEEYDDDE